MASPHPSGWTRHVNQSDGRPYWSHPQHGSSWTKPKDLKTPLELEVEKTPWDEYETGGRKYWVNRDSNETTWNCPREITGNTPAVPTPPRPGPPPSAPSGFAQSPPLGGPASPALTAQSGALVGPGGYTPAGLPPRPGGVPVSAAAAPTVYTTYGEASRAFKAMLKRIGVDRSWGWEMVMKEAITDPAYRALTTLQERKGVFEEFLVEEEKREKDEREKSLARCRKDWTKAMDKLGGGVAFEDGVKSWWSWERGARVMREKCPDAWDLPRNDDERRILFEEYVNKLRATEETRKREMRGRNMDKVTAILQSLALDLAGPVRWSDARGLVMRTPEWHRDPELQRIEPIDLLTVFEDEVRRAEKEMADARARVAEEKRRRGRKARDDFNALLTELVASKHLSAGTPWSAVYTLISRDARYLSLLGMPGSSSPLDLFWDRVDELDVQAEEALVLLEAVAREKGCVFGEETKLEEWEKALEGDERVKALDAEVVRSTFETLHHRAVRTARESRRRAEKALRIAVDDLRYLFKRLDDPPVDVDADTFEAVVERAEVKEAQEWKALEGNDEARRSAWEKFVRRTKEKRAEREAADADRAERDRAYERQRDLEREAERAERARRGSSAAAVGEERQRRGSSAMAGAGAAGAEGRKRAFGREGSRDVQGEVGAAADGGERERKVARLEDGSGDVTMQTRVGGDGSEEGEL
ncbi:U1 snRNP protein [Rhodotorula kratochvilovae]